MLKTDANRGQFDDYVHAEMGITNLEERCRAQLESITSRTDIEVGQLESNAKEDGDMVDALYADCLECIKIATTAVIPNQGRGVHAKTNWFAKYRDKLMPLIDKKNKKFADWRAATVGLRSLAQVEIPGRQAYKTAAKKVKAACKKYREEYYQNVVLELEELFNTNNMYGYYKTRQLDNRGDIFRKGVGGEPDRLVTGKEEIILVWRDYFKSLLNQDNAVGVDAGD